VRYLLGDHLSSTTLTTNSSGERQAELRYFPYGKTRYSSKNETPSVDTPTTFRFTGQRQQTNANELYYYNARWYDPLVGRFLSADTIVPDPKNPQALNRYSYTLNSPLRYVDPSGHFSEEQLESWYGKRWRELFHEAWITFLLEAEFGDILANGSQSIVVAEQNGLIAGWDVNARSACSIAEIAGRWNGNETSLYRPYGANEQGGRTHTWGFGEGTNVEGVLYNHSNEYRWILGRMDAPKNRTLPLDWYRGGTTHVNVQEYFAGFDLGPEDYFSSLAQMYSAVAAYNAGAGLLGAVTAGLGGPIAVGATVFVVNVAAWSTSDTGYSIQQGPGTPYMVPVPMPPRGTPER
jgi:RHS repeat-associated protein